MELIGIEKLWKIEKLKTLFLGLVLLTLYTSGFSQGFENHSFKSISVNDNLSHSDVNCIVQDSKGYIWIGTNNGLNKFDGYKIVTYKYTINEEKSLPGNRVTNIILDANGIIWITITNKGLYTFDPDLMNFEKVKIKTWKNIENDLYNFDIVVGNENNIWLRNKDGQLINLEIDEQSKIINEISVQINQDLFPEITSPTAIGRGMFFLSPNGLIGYYTDSELSLRTLAYNSVKYGNVKAIASDQKILYALSASHLLKFRLDQDSIVLDQALVLSTSKEYSIGKMKVDRLGDVWFSNRNMLCKIVESKFSSNLSSDYEVLEFPIKNINLLYDDNFGVLWLGTIGYGIHYTNLVKKPFYHLTNHQSHAKLISAIYRDNEKRIWLGSRQGLTVYEPVVFPFQYRVEKEYLEDKYVAFIEADKKDNIYLGLKNSGVFKVVEDGRKLSFLDIEEVIDDDLSEMKSLMRMTIDQKGRLWITTFYNGIFILDLENKSAERIEHLNGDPNSLSSNKLTDIYCDPLEGDVWVGTRDAGLNKISYNEKGDIKVSNFRYLKEDKNSLSSDHTWQMLRLRDSSLWVATLGGGLNEIVKLDNLGNYQFKRYTTEDGLVDDNVEGIADDAEGNIWISGVGISKLDLDSGHIIHYDYLDGLQSNSFKVGAVFQDEDDWVYFGGINGINYFQPSQIEADSTLPKVYISEINVNNDESISENKICNNVEVITLNANENNLTFSFIGLQFNAPKKNKYKYKLLGHDKDWTYVKFPNLFANYLNVPSGDYTFQVMASNSDGIWNPKITQAKLKIAKPWYWTNAAFGFYFLLIIGALYLFRKITENQFNLKNDLLLAEKEHEMDRSKLSFFTKISHELRSPLTLIKGPLEELLLFTKLNQTTKNKLQLMQKSTDRLLNLTNQLLDFRKMETGNMQIKTRSQNFMKFAHEIFLLFSQSASNKDINYEFSASQDKAYIMFDADKMEIILMNLLSNAFKNTAIQGHIKMVINVIGNPEKNAVWINSEMVDHYINIEVIDDGFGMTKEEVNKVFNPYYQVRNVSATQPIGTGLGLSLVKGLIKLHKGEIFIASTKGEGTCCSAKLPFGSIHLSPDQIEHRIPIKDGLSSYNALEKKSMILPEVKDYLNRFGELSKKYKILIVEDNLDLNAYIKDVLSQEFTVETAFNGMEGFELTLEFEPDLILSDVMMPILDGIGLCEKIKQNDKTAHIPIILLTARTSFVYQVNGLSKGAEDYISKPFSTSLLITKIHAILNNRALQREFYRKQLFFEPVKETQLNPEEELVYNAIQYIEENINNIELDVKSLSDAMCQSQSNLYRKVKLVTGKSLVELIKDVRIKYAGRLLREKKYTVTEVAYKSGFNSIKYFRKCFKAQYNVNPSEFHLIDFSPENQYTENQVKYN